MSVNEIAQLTGYTPRLIQYECKQGHLKATLTTRKQGWHIDKQDYIAWRSAFKTWRKPYRKGRNYDRNR